MHWGILILRLLQRKDIYVTSTWGHNDGPHLAYKLTPACSDAGLFRCQPVPTAACSDGGLFRRRPVPTPAYSDDGQLRRRPVLTPTYSDADLFRSRLFFAVITMRINEKVPLFKDYQNIFLLWKFKKQVPAGIIMRPPACFPIFLTHFCSFSTFKKNR